MNIQPQAVPTRLAWLEGVCETMIEVVSILVGSEGDPAYGPEGQERIRAATAARMRELGDQRATEAMLDTLDHDGEAGQ